jgi:hypothetical protein
MLIEVGSIDRDRPALCSPQGRTDRADADFVGQIYKEVDFTDIASESEAVHRWAARDLGLPGVQDALTTRRCTAMVARPGRARSARFLWYLAT